MTEYNAVQASSLCFDPPPRGVAFSPADSAGGAKASGLDLSSAAQQRRTSVELGMGGLSHKSIMAGGAQAACLRGFPLAELGLASRHDIP